MPFLTFQKSSAYGPLVDVTLLPSKAGMALLSQSNLPVAAPVTCKLLVDTGADQTLIEDSAIAAWNLPYTGFGFARMGGQRVRLRSFELSMRISVIGNPNVWEIEPIRVDAMATAFGNKLPYIGLIGRDVLDKALFIYNGAGNHYTLAY